MAATARQEREMKMKMEKRKNDPNISTLERLRAYVMSRGVRSLKSLHRVFKRHDVNGDKKIDYDEFVNALHCQGIYVEKELYRECFDEIDKSGEGSIDMEEFIVALRPPMTKRRLDLVSQAFNKLDKSGDGVVTSDDLKGVYVATKHPKFINGQMTEEDVFKEWLNSFNGPDNFSGEVIRDEFDDYYSGVSASIDTDAYFDLMMRQAWKL